MPHYKWVATPDWEKGATFEDHCAQFLANSANLGAAYVDELKKFSDEIAHVLSRLRSETEAHSRTFCRSLYRFSLAWSVYILYSDIKNESVNDQSRESPDYEKFIRLPKNVIPLDKAFGGPEEAHRLIAGTTKSQGKIYRILKEIGLSSFISIDHSKSEIAAAYDSWNESSNFLAEVWRIIVFPAVIHLRNSDVQTSRFFMSHGVLPLELYLKFLPEIIAIQSQHQKKIDENVSSKILLSDVTSASSRIWKDLTARSLLHLEADCLPFQFRTSYLEVKKELRAYVSTHARGRPSKKAKKLIETVRGFRMTIYRTDQELDFAESQ
jgi:hypothetical protein